MLEIPIGEGNSDSQDLDRAIETLCSRDGLSLAEAMETVVPPIVAEIVALPEELHSFYMYLRQLMGPFAQGPVALMARHGDECVFSADALGLRPLWAPGPSRTSSSAPSRAWSRWRRWSASRSRWPREVHGHHRPGQAQLHPLSARGDAARGEEALAAAHRGRGDGPLQGRAQGLAPLEGREVPGYSAAGPADPVEVPDRVLAGFGWQREDTKLVSRWPRTVPSRSARSATTARWPRSRPSARTWPTTSRRRWRWSPTRRSTASARSSTSPPGRSSGADPASATPAVASTVATDIPVLLGGHHEMAPLGDSVYRRVAAEHGTYLLEDLWEEFRDRPGGGHDGCAKAIDIALLESETTQERSSASSRRP